MNPPPAWVTRLLVSLFGLSLSRTYWSQHHKSNINLFLVIHNCFFKLPLKRCATVFLISESLSNLHCTCKKICTVKNSRELNASTKAISRIPSVMLLFRNNSQWLLQFVSEEMYYCPNEVIDAVFGVLEFKCNAREIRQKSHFLCFRYWKKIKCYIQYKCFLVQHNSLQNTAIVFKKKRGKKGFWKNIKKKKAHYKTM